MKKTLLTLLLITVATSLNAKTSVWRIDSDTRSVYIGGTFHLLRASDYPLPSEFNTAFENSDMLVFEADIGEMTNPAAQQLMMSKAMLEGKTLEDILAPKTYELLTDYCNKLGVPVDALKGFKPSMVILSISMMEIQKLNFTTQGVDAHFYAKGIQEGKTMGSLETVEEQIEFLMSMGEGNEDKFVTHSLEDLNQINDVMFSLLKAWKSGDRSDLRENFIDTMKDDFPNLYNSLILQRNENWLPKIQSYFETDETEYVLVGVGHLVGEDGILNRLEKHGFTVTPLEDR